MTLPIKVAGVVGALVVLANPVMAQEHTWRLGHVKPPSSSYMLVVESIPERLAKATGGKLKIDLYSSLVKGKDQPGALRDGRLDAIVGVHPWLSGTAPTLSAGELPGLFQNVHEYKKALNAFLFDYQKQLWAEKFNGVMLAAGAFDRLVILSKKPLRTVEDFRGVKIRVPSAGMAQLMNMLGAKPVQLAFPEIAPALGRGVVDAVLTDAGTSYGMGFYNVAKYVNVWRPGVSSWAVVINKNSWSKLPPDLQEAVAGEFKAIEEDHFAGYTTHSDTMIAKMVEKGMTLIEPSQTEIDKAYSKSHLEAVYNAFYALAEKTGEDGRRVVAEIREFQNK